jgi:hypothetical protein
LLGDITRTDDQHPLAGQLIGHRVVPPALLAGPLEPRELAEHRQQRGQRPFGGGRAVHATGIAELDPVRTDLQQDVHPGRLGLDHPEFRHRRDGSPAERRVGDAEVRNPEPDAGQLLRRRVGRVVDDRAGEHLDEFRLRVLLPPGHRQATVTDGGRG